MELRVPEKEVEYKASVDENGLVVLKKESKIKLGRKAKAGGAQFELKVRKDLQRDGWIVDKWSNNVDLENGALTPAKKSWKFNPFRKAMMPSAQGTGFPDFIAFQKMNDYYKIIGVEVKMNGTLSKIEKLKCKWMLDNKIFSEILVAKKKKFGRRILVEYVNFSEILKRMR